MGMVQLELSKSLGVEYMQGEASGLDIDDAGRVAGVRVRHAAGEVSVWMANCIDFG
jgi:hypothetical protein